MTQRLKELFALAAILYLLIGQIVMVIGHVAEEIGLIPKVTLQELSWRAVFHCTQLQASVLLTRVLAWPYVLLRVSPGEPRE